MNADPVPEVSPAEAFDLVQRGAVLLDVREGSEWAAGHAESAVHMPLGQLDLVHLPQGHPVVAICRSGNRSGRAAERLQSQGYDVRNVAGGMAGWEQAGLLVVTDSGTPGRIA